MVCTLTLFMDCDDGYELHPSMYELINKYIYIHIKL